MVKAWRKTSQCFLLFSRLWCRLIVLTGDTDQTAYMQILLCFILVLSLPVFAGVVSVSSKKHVKGSVCEAQPVFFFLISDLQTDINRNFCGAPFKPDQLAGSTLHSLIHSKTPRVVKLHRSSEIWRTLSYGTLHGLLTMARGCTLTPWSITCIVLVCSTRPQPSNWHWASPFPQQGSKELKEALEVLLWENGTKSLGQP